MLSQINAYCCVGGWNPNLVSNKLKVFTHQALVHVGPTSIPYRLFFTSTSLIYAIDISETYKRAQKQILSDLRLFQYSDTCWIENSFHIQRPLKMWKYLAVLASINPNIGYPQSII